MTSIIYPIVVYWGWSGAGFLNNSEKYESGSAVGPGLMDFAGSGIVHMVGGVAALCGSIIVGPRNGRFESSEAVSETSTVPQESSGNGQAKQQKEIFEAHNVPLVVLGTFFLWFGWYGFNPGSTGSMHDKETANTAGLVAVNTTLAPCMAGLVVFFLRAKVLEPKMLDICGFCNGILAGLVAITAGCNAVRPWEACFIGFIGGFVYQAASMLLRRLKIDDVVDAFPVHGACGCWGVLALGFFGNPEDGIGGNGCFYGGNQMGTQIVAVLIIGAWTAALSCMVLIPLKLSNCLRLSNDFQQKGADEMEHSPPKAYAPQYLADKI